MRDYSNPFNPGSGLDPPYLAGRDRELDGFTRMLHRVRAGKVENMLVHGLRGVGKTVLLNRFSQICADEGFLPIVRRQYSSKYSDPGVFIRALQYDLDRALGLLSKTSKAKKRIKNVAEYMRPASIEIPGVLSYQPAYGVEANAPMEDQIYNYLSRVWKTIENSNLHGAILMMDEFHAVCDIKARGQYVLTDFVGALNTLQIDGYGYSLVLCGLPILVSNIKSARSYSERMFGSVRVSNLGENAAREAILKPAREARLIFSGELVSAILRDTDRYPYFIQFFCSELVYRADKKHINLDDYSAARDSIIEKLGHDFFAPRLEHLSSTQRDVLYAMASIRKKDVDLASIITAARIDKGSVYNHLKRLEGKGMVFRSQRGIYNFTLPLFMEYLLDTLASDNSESRQSA